MGNRHIRFSAYQYDSWAGGTEITLNLLLKANGDYFYSVDNSRPDKRLPARYRNSVQELSRLLGTPGIAQLLEDYCSTNSNKCWTPHPAAYQIVVEENGASLLDWSNQIGLLFKDLPDGVLNDIRKSCLAILNNRPAYVIPQDYVDSLSRNGGAHVNNQPPKPNYFWVTTNPKYWQLDVIRVKSKEFFTSMNDQGKPRNYQSCFEKAKPGDRVLFYEAQPSSAIVAEGIVSQGLHMEQEYPSQTSEEGITLQYIRDIGPVSMHLLRQIRSLNNILPIKMKANGTIFELNESEFRYILDLAAPEPAFVKGLIYIDLMEDGYQDLFDIRAGSLIGRATMKNNDIVIPVQIRPAGPYTQTDFERDLEALYDKLKRIMSLLASGYTIKLVFEAGTEYDIPDWFMNECRTLNVTIEFRISDTIVVGRIIASPHFIGLIIQIHVQFSHGRSKYTQQQFHVDLMDLLEKIKIIQRTYPEYRIALLFELGGKLELPPDFIDKCLDLGIEIAFEFRCGSLTGRIVLGKSSILVRLDIDDDYTQQDFERDLHLLLKELKGLKKRYLLNMRFLLFPVGGNLIIPELFEYNCRKLGISIQGKFDIDQVWDNWDFL
jgi:hypothetical protein